MPVYEHVCRTCGNEWQDTHTLEDYAEHREDPCECGSTDCYIACTTSAAIHFKGAGWSPDGYNKHRSLDKYKKQGVKVYDKKEDHDREVRGEAEQAELKTLKAKDRAAKKAFGHDAGVTQKEADAAIKKAGQERVDGPKEHPELRAPRLP